MRIVAPVGLAGGIVWILAAPLAMKIAYGQDFSNGGSALQWMAGACLAAAISGHYRFGLIAAGLQNNEMWASAFGALAAILLIPIGYLNAGISGAAAALCVAEFFVLAVVWLISKRKLFNRNPLPIENNNFESLSEAAR
jgi:O-antigen/teichoic acid export membrane protein